tara:strand:- start:312 stop:731 length:420 start_codon:yes stop_codon:yes gene_type:complete
MALGIFEVFELASKEKTNKAKAKVLVDNSTFALKTVIQGCFHPNIKFLLPPTVPPFSEADGVQVETRLHSFAKKFDLFVEGGRPVATQTKREMLFIEMLEAIHPEDAKIVLNMVNKKNPSKGITKAVAKLAFPELFPEE